MKISKIIKKSNSKYGLFLLLCLVVIISVGFVFWVQNKETVDAGFNNANSRFEDSLIIPHQIAEYTYVYSNDSNISQVGYFELVLQNVSGSFPGDVLRVLSVTDTYPVDAGGNGGISNAVPINIASFTSGNKLTIRVSPQNPCVQRILGGCQDVTISPGVRGKIKIQLAYRENPPIGQHIFGGQGAVYFPTSINLPLVGWRIVTNLQKSNFVLNPQISPIAIISGPGGSGEPLFGSNYTVLVTEIKSTDGSNLEAPSGKCSVSVDSQVFESFGISGGKCLVPISREALGVVSGGVVVINDGGNPISLSRNIDFSPRNSITNISEYKAFIDNVTKTSTEEAFLVYFSLTGFTNGASDIHTQFYFDNQNSNVLDNIYFGASPLIITKDSVPIGANKICVIVARPDNSILENSGNCRDLSAPVNIPTGEETKTRITNDDIVNLTFSCDLAIIKGSTRCDVLFPVDKRLPDEGLRIGIGNVTLGGSCTKIADLASCENIPVGDVIGSNLIYASVGENEPQLTGEKAVLLDENGQGIDDVIGTDGLSDEELAELKNIANQFGVSLDQLLSDKGINNSLGKSIVNTNTPNSDLSRTGAGFLITFGMFGFLVILILYIFSYRDRAKELRQNGVFVNTKKINKKP
jgi:hypothetical protein